MTLAAGQQHRRRIDQIDHAGRPPRWAQPHDSSTSPCETLAACLRRCVAAARPVSRPATWPTWRWPILGADIRSRCSAAAPPASSGSPTPTTAARVCSTPVRCSVRWPCAGVAGERAAARRGPAWTAAITAATTFVALGGTSLTRTGARMADVLSRDDLGAARRLLPSLCGRDPAALDSDGLARAAVESVAENTSDAQVAPLLWAAVGGVPALLVYRGANTLDAMIGHRSPRYQRFGWAAARFDDALNFVAARVTGVLVAICAPVVGGSPRGCVAGLAARRRPAPQPQRRGRRSGIRRRAGRPARRTHAIRPPAGDPADPRRRARAADRRSRSGGAAVADRAAGRARCLATAVGQRRLP